MRTDPTLQFKESQKLMFAPMMGYTDRHCRFIYRLLAPKMKLFTEMLTPNAIIYGIKNKILKFHFSEQPLVIQLGGSEVHSMVEAGKIIEDYGYKELNLNIGCPSERVKNGNFGACLMKEPELVAELVYELKKNTNLIISVKHRIGVDEYEDFDFLKNFVELNEQAGCDYFIVHARKAILKGLSPKENRTVPPINYPVVQKLKSVFEHKDIIVNGEINNLVKLNQLEGCDGYMVGREFYANPYYCVELYNKIYQENRKIDLINILETVDEYLKCSIDEFVKVNHITRHIQNLFMGFKNAKKFRSFLSNQSVKQKDNPDFLLPLIQELKDNPICV